MLFLKCFHPIMVPFWWEKLIKMTTQKTWLLCSWILFFNPFVSWPAISDHGKNNSDHSSCNFKFVSCKSKSTFSEQCKIFRLVLKNQISINKQPTESKSFWRSIWFSCGWISMYVLQSLNHWILLSHAIGNKLKIQKFKTSNTFTFDKTFLSHLISDGWNCNQNS